MIARYEGRGLCDPQKAQQIVRSHLPERITRLKSKVSTVDAYVFFFKAGLTSLFALWFGDERLPWS